MASVPIRVDRDRRLHRNGSNLAPVAYILIQAGRPENIYIYWPTFVTRILTPRSRKSGYGLLLGCRSQPDAGREKRFFGDVETKKPGKSSSDGRARYRNRSGVVELVGRGALMFARVENGVTKFSPQRQ